MNLTELAAVATVGARHRAIDLDAVAAELQPVMVADDPAVVLLDVAALVSCARRTVPTAPAFAPSAVSTAPEPERLPVISDQVRQVLSRLADHHEPLVEALTVIHAAGQRLPPELVPALLDDTRADVVAATRRVFGEVGRWLTTKNPRWPTVIVDPTDRTAWEDGTQAQRVDWLHQLRRSDPAAARQVLENELAGESAAARAAFLPVLIDGLAAEDEPLLVRMFADRSKAVAAAAYHLLVRLPGSAARRDMEAIVARHIQVRRGLLRTTVTVDEAAPEEFGDWPGGNDGLGTALARVDPSDWPRVVDAVDLMAQVRKGNQALEPLRESLVQAAITFQHTELAAVLVEEEIAAMNPKVPATITPALWAALDPVTGGRLIGTLAGRNLRPEVVMDALGALQSPWSRELDTFFPGWFFAAAGDRTVYGAKALWTRWASSVALVDCSAAATAARAAVAAAGQDPARLRPVGSAITVVALRSLLAEAFTSATGVGQRQ